MKTSVPRALAISDRASLPGSDLVDWARRLVIAGVEAIQVREKDLSGKDLYALASRMRSVRPAIKTLSINGRLDVALASNASGVHLPESSAPLARIRGRYPELLLGKSCHTLEQVADALEAGADYVTYGPVFAPLSKVSSLPPVGLEELGTACSIGIPVLALGGVTAERLQGIASTGASGIAGIGLFHAPEALGWVMTAVRELFDHGGAGEI